MIDFSYVLQIVGAFGFGMLLGWYLYYINRHRKEEIKFSDLVSLVSVLGGGAILTLFPAKSDLFGAYGIGLAIGFFGYFIILLIFVWKSSNFDIDYFIDGRKKLPDGTISVPSEGQPVSGGAMKDSKPDENKSGMQ
jgi:hypothetical protein